MLHVFTLRANSRAVHRQVTTAEEPAKSQNEASSGPLTSPSRVADVRPPGALSRSVNSRLDHTQRRTQTTEERVSQLGARSLRTRAGANSGPELDCLANSNSGIGIGIELAFPSLTGIGIELELPVFELELP